MFGVAPVRIFKEITFEAAHRLPNVPKDHKCYNLHGHNFRCRVEAEGEIDPTLGWVVDFGILDAVMQPMIRQLDHRYLNEVAGLDNPTSENIAAWILERLRLTMIGNKMKSVTIWETESCGAIAE